MKTSPAIALDITDHKLLKALEANARLSFAQLGRMVGLSPPAAAERIRRMEDFGVIEAYRAQINLETLGRSLLAFIQLSTTPNQYPKIYALLQTMPMVLECHHVTGNCSLILKVAIASMAELEQLIGQLSRYGTTNTSLVLSSPLTDRLRSESLD